MKNQKPKIAESAYVTEQSMVIGDVTIGEESCVLFYATLRGDADKIIIGSKTNIQESCTLHADFGNPIIVGDRVTIGHNAIVHGCCIGDESMVGMGAIVMNGAKIGKQCLIAAGSLVTQNTEVPDGMMVMGSPAKVTRPLTEEEIKYVYDSSEEYMEVSRQLKEQNDSQER